MPNKNKNITPEEVGIQEIEIEKNKSLCMQETGMASQESTALRQIATKYGQFLISQDYQAIKPLLTEQLQTDLEKNNIAEKKLDVFLPGASQILKAIGAFKIEAIYKIETNPDSTEIQGVCKNLENPVENLFYKINNPTADMAALYLTGTKGKTFANSTILLVKKDNEWKINYISIFPGGAGGLTTYELYQYAAKYHEEGKKNLAYLLYELIASITPTGNLMPEYILKTHQAINDINVSLPDKEKQLYQEWKVAEDLALTVYEVKAMPVQDKLILFVGYLTDTDDLQLNDAESELLKNYIKNKYSDLAYFFTLLITEATFEVPQTEDYLHYSKLQKL
jgi:hypothetical protein